MLSCIIPLPTSCDFCRGFHLQTSRTLLHTDFIAQRCSRTISSRYKAGMMGTSGNGGSGEARKYAAMDFSKVGARNKSGSHPGCFCRDPSADVYLHGDRHQSARHAFYGIGDVLATLDERVGLPCSLFSALIRAEQSTSVGNLYYLHPLKMGRAIFFFQHIVKQVS
jgi:hypothetical protein